MGEAPLSWHAEMGIRKLWTFSESMELSDRSSVNATETRTLVWGKGSGQTDVNGC